MRFRRWMCSMGATLLLSCVSLGFGGERDVMAQSQPANSKEKTPDEYAQEGRELALKDDFQNAYVAYMEAWKRKKGYEVAGNLGVVELRLGKPREALEHFLYCEANFPATRDAEQEKKLETLRHLMKEARAQVGAARIRVTREDGASAEGAAIYVDGRAVGKVGGAGRVVQPVVSTGEVYVSAGSRRFSASLAGCEDASRVMGVPKGGSVDAALVLSCGGGRSWPLILGGFGIAAAQIGVGAGALGYALGRREEAADLYDELSGGGTQTGACSAPSPPKCADLRSANEDWVTYAWVGGVGMGVGAVVAAAAAIWGLSGSSSKEGMKKDVRTSFVLGSDGGGAVLRGSF